MARSSRQRDDRLRPLSGGVAEIGADGGRGAMDQDHPVVPTLSQIRAEASAAFDGPAGDGELEAVAGRIDPQRAAVTLNQAVETPALLPADDKAGISVRIILQPEGKAKLDIAFSRDDCGREPERQQPLARVPAQMLAVITARIASGFSRSGGEMSCDEPRCCRRRGRHDGKPDEDPSYRPSCHRHVATSLQGSSEIDVGFLMNWKCQESGDRPHSGGVIFLTCGVRSASPRIDRPQNLLPVVATKVRIGDAGGVWHLGAVTSGARLEPIQGG